MARAKVEQFPQATRHKATGAAAVMADRAFGAVDGDSAEVAKYRSLDFFPTPPWASRAGAELIRRLDPHARIVREPAAGMGHMADALAEVFPEVLASDVHDYGRGYPIEDWCADEPYEVFDWVVTNPPFSKAAEFARLGLQRATRGVALLCRLAFVETSGRYELMRTMQVFAPFAERVPMVLGRWDPKIGTATAHAWFIWIRPDAGGIELDAAAWRAPQLMIVPPGTRDRLWRPGDPELYGSLTPDPLDKQGDLWGEAGEDHRGLLIGREP